MKKLTFFALAFALCTACAVSALAADATSGTIRTLPPVPQKSQPASNPYGLRFRQREKTPRGAPPLCGGPPPPQKT